MRGMRSLLQVLAIAAVLPVFAADDTDAPAQAPGQNAPGERSEMPLVTAEDAAPSGGRTAEGPSVEFITGGNSKDGAARVGRLPVID